MVEISSDNYPKLYELLNTIAFDSYAGHRVKEIYEISEFTDEYLNELEESVKKLTHEEQILLAIGEVEELSIIVEKYNLQKVDKFLDYLFTHLYYL